MPCKHMFININDIAVCRKCGLTICDKGKAVIIDKYAVSEIRKKRDRK